MSGQRKAQIALIASTFNTQGDAGLTQLYNEMYVFNADRLRKARRSGYVVERHIGIPSKGLWQKIRQRFF